jgi:hypothetical protein
LQPALTYASESFNNVKQWMSEIDKYARCSLHRRTSPPFKKERQKRVSRIHGMRAAAPRMLWLVPLAFAR